VDRGQGTAERCAAALSREKPKAAYFVWPVTDAGVNFAASASSAVASCLTVTGGCAGGRCKTAYALRSAMPVHARWKEVDGERPARDNAGDSANENKASAHERDSAAGETAPSSGARSGLAADRFALWRDPDAAALPGADAHDRSTARSTWCDCSHGSSSTLE